MKYAIVSVLLLNLVGCAVYGKYADMMDTCQIGSRPAGTPAPSYCGASAGKSITVTQGLSKNNYLVNVR